MTSERKPRCGANTGPENLLYVEMGFPSLKVFIQNIAKAIIRETLFVIQRFHEI